MRVFLVLAAVAFAQWLADVKVRRRRRAADRALHRRGERVAPSRPARGGRARARRRPRGGARSEDGGSGEFVGLSALAIAAGVLGTSVRHRRALLASLEDRAARLELERDQQGLLAAAAERARIAREMHDIVAHNLTVMIALADGAVFAAERAPEKATTAMETVSATGRQALTEMRRLLGVLRDDEARHRCCCHSPGVPQIDQLVEQVRAAGLPVTLEVAGDGRALPAGAQLTVFRLVQEALTNTLKHAGASAAAACACATPGDGVDVEVTDTGSGGRGAAATGRPWARRHARARRRVRRHRRGRPAQRRRLARARAPLARAAVGARMTTSILLVDDQPLLRMGFRMVLESQDDLVVVGEAGDGGEAVR